MGNNEHLEFVFVPLGLLVFFLYHAWLLFTILREPHRTVIGLNAESRIQWVHAMMSVSHSILYTFSLKLMLELLMFPWQVVYHYCYFFIHCDRCFPVSKSNTELVELNLPF